MVLMTKKELIKNLETNIYCRIGKSKIHGVGVIAVRDIPRGINPFIGSYDGEYYIYQKEELEQLDLGVQDMIKDFFRIEKNTIYIPRCGLNAIDVSFFLNHSKNPNVVSEDGIIFTAINEIKKGEELTCNYSMSFGEDNISHTMK